ncbi:MAG: DUF4258 domain-containing protein [Chloroflexi bacterium]|nr:MAG: DUF4258 domain-containing protein [Chloroflexota bacterium]TMC36629.1 MAG: DUF4258 domain-containing protein [Chloroflexota bacterium]TME38517.1 MAG: DUF4258 domain-containing protein [Chloroflexota bacterium]
MDQRPVVWAASNTKHVDRDHAERGITRDDVNEVLNDPRRIETTEVRKGTEHHAVTGSTRNGRVLFIIWVDHPDGRFPVHARRAGRKLAKEYFR